MPQLNDHTIAFLRLGHGARTQLRHAWDGFINFAARDNVLEVALGLMYQFAPTLLPLYIYTCLVFYPTLISF